MSRPVLGRSPGALPWPSLLRAALLALALGLIVAAVVNQWDPLVDGVRRLDAPTLLLAFLAVLVGAIAAMLAWRALLAGLGSVLPVPVAGRIYLLSQLGKYVPGSVWPVLAQVELGRDHQVPRMRSGVAAVAVLVVSLSVGIAVAVPCLALSGSGALRQYWWVLLALPAGAALVSPPVLQRLLDLALRLSRRSGAATRVSGQALLRAVGWLLVMWVCFGVQAWLLARGLGSGHDRLLLLTTGAYALAWIVGFLVVVAPAGAGVREGVLLLVLAPALGRPEALALALISRMLMLAGDLLTSAVAVLAARRSRRPEPTPTAAASTAVGLTDQPTPDLPKRGGHG